jgi:hypothetical protein
MTIEVTTDDEAKVEFIDVHVEGRQGWSIGSGKARVTVSHELPTWSARLMDEGSLAPRTSTPFDVRFPLPRGTAPTHEIAPAHASLRVRVHVSLPWRIDVRSTFELPVRLPPPAHVDRTPVVVRSGGPRPAPDAQRMEVSLASSRLVAGEVLIGSVALYNLDARRRIDVELVPILRLYGRGQPRERRGVPLRARLALPVDHGGRATPLSLALPATLTPSFETVTHALGWRLEVTSDTPFGREVAVRHPLEVVDAAAAATSARLTAAPRLADDRIEALLRATATGTAWRVEPRPEDEHALPSIARDLGGAGDVRLTYSYRGDEGTFLRARVEHPSLGLGLRVAPGSVLRHLFWSDVEAGVPAWDRAHVVAARFGAQARPFLAAAVPAVVVATDVLGALVSWDDHALTFERAMPIIHEEDLRSMQWAVEAVAGAIERARASAIAPPPGLAVDLPAWRALAASLDGDLAAGDLTLTGTIGGVPATATLEWEGARPVRVRALVGDAETAGEQLRRASLRLAQPLADVLAFGMPEAVVDCVARWPTDIVDVQVADGVASGTIALVPAAAGDGDGDGDAATAPLATDPERVRTLLLSLRALLAALVPAAAPYR